MPPGENHPSNPDQLMARTLGVCWHSPTADRRPCQQDVSGAVEVESVFRRRRSS